jgi:anthranilate phosphoribosyltransferase
MTVNHSPADSSVTAPLVLRDVLERLLAGESLAEAEAQQLLVQLTDESLSPAMVAAQLVALRAKGVVADEVRGFAKGMRALARRPELPEVGKTVDVVGTGGDGSGSVNLSTGAALLAAAAGAQVVKHGNRSISSRSGSADLLEALGLKLPLQGADIGGCLTATGFTFLFAPHHHPAMKAVGPVRGAMGIRTVFNLLGPLTNPAAPPFGLIGAFNLDTAKLMAEAFAGLPIERVFVVHGEPGWDEPTPCGPFHLFDVKSVGSKLPPTVDSASVGASLLASVGSKLPPTMDSAPVGASLLATDSAFVGASLLATVTHTVRDPLTDYGLPRCRPEDLAGGDAAHNTERLLQVFRGEDQGAHRHALLLGAALVLEVTGQAATPREALAMAAAAIDSGAALRMAEALRAFGANASATS